MKYAIIHCSDIHYRKKESEGASAILNSFIDDIKIQKKEYPDYEFYLSITGDIVFFGKDNEAYTIFHTEFDKRLNDIGLTKDFRMMVPGNHDIDQDIILSDIKNIKDNIYSCIETEPKFNNYISSKKYQDTKFDNYLIFESYFAKYGINFSHQGKGWVINDNLGVYCLNTALCSFGGAERIKDKGSLAICTRGLYDWCKETNTTTNILLMHHPINHLTKWCKDELSQIIEKNFSLCLCGHNHEQKLYYNKISNSALICSSPQLFTSKNDFLGYAILFIKDKFVDRMAYRQYVKGKFFNGTVFSETDDGIVEIQNSYHERIDYLERQLKDALVSFKTQPEVFIKPKLSEDREFNNNPNLLDEIIKEPRSAIIAAQPQFGLTCLSHYIRLAAFQKNAFWIYIDARDTKARKVENKIVDQLKYFNKQVENIQGIIIDSWEGSVIDHGNILKCIDSIYSNIPILLMANYSGLNFDSSFDFSKLNTKFDILHLQALQREKVREFVTQFSKVKNLGNEDMLVSKVVKDLEVLNIHRTPLNCLTLLKVFERDFNEELINRTKMIKAVLFILFTDADSFTYSSNKPNVDDCEYVLGRFCKSLLEEGRRRFSALELKLNLRKYCEEKLISVDIDTIIDIFESNTILLRFNEDLEFKHSYWIYYFAATYMLYDEIFMSYILSDRNYVNYPEIIEFYTGIDGRRDEAIQILLNDVKELTETVNNKIGLFDDFNPLEEIFWNPSGDEIERIREEITDKVNESNMPLGLKDFKADQCYNSEAPYDQSIRKFLNEYSVISLMQGIKASSRALRNSSFVKTESKLEMIKAIMNGWEQIAKVIFWLSPILAKEGRACFEGFGLIIFGDLQGSFPEKLKRILLANPKNVLQYLKDDLSSKKIGPLIFDSLRKDIPTIQKHLIALFLIHERPNGWADELFEHMNMIHRNAFYMGDLKGAIENEIKYGFVSKRDMQELKKLLLISIAKHKIAPRKKLKKISKTMIINPENKIPIDKILSFRNEPYLGRKT